MSHSARGWYGVLGAVLLAACDASPVAPSLEGEVQALNASVPVTTANGSARTATEREKRPDRTRPDADRRRVGDRRQHRLQAAARRAIDHAKDLLARAVELADREDRPAVLEALSEARQMIDQAIGAYENGDYNRALIKAKQAIELLEKIIRYLS